MLIAGVRQIGGGDDGLDAGQRRGLAGVDAHDAGVGVRAAQDAAVQQAGRGEVGAVERAAGDLVRAVVADRRVPITSFVFLVSSCFHLLHFAPPPAATARTILS